MSSLYVVVLVPTTTRRKRQWRKLAITVLLLAAMSLLLVIFSSMLCAVNAQTIPEADKMLELDQDEDGTISIREAVADPSLLALFGKIDTNGDAKISIEELKSYQQPLMVKKHR